MLTAIRVVQMLVRALFALMLVLGVLFWTGRATALVPLHILLGLVLAVCLLFLAVTALTRREPAGLPALLVVWAVVLPVYGLAQDQIWQGSSHWIVQVFHLLLGAGAVAVAEIVVARARRRRAVQASP